MKKADILAKMLIADIENKTVLEPACGAADFSLSASAYTDRVYCIDIDAGRLDAENTNKFNFRLMDAAEMDFADNTFDTIVIFNAFYHIQSQWASIKKECMRVLKNDGVIYIVGTWKLDVNVMMECFGDKAKRRDDFLIAEIRKK